MLHRIYHTDISLRVWITPYHEKKLPIYMTIMTETPTLPRWIAGTTRLPPARTETAHAFSGHRSLGRWQRPTTDPYHHMINVNVNIKYHSDIYTVHVYTTPNVNLGLDILMCIPSSPRHPTHQELTISQHCGQRQSYLGNLRSLTTIFCWSKCNLLGE